MAQRIVGMLIFPRLTQLDMTGPYEVLARLPNTKVHLVSHTLDPVRTDRGMMIMPTVFVLMIMFICARFVRMTTPILMIVAVLVRLRLGIALRMAVTAIMTTRMFMIVFLSLATLSCM